MYDAGALDAAWDLVKDWTGQEHEELRAAVPRAGLKTPFRDGTVLDIAARVLDISLGGLRARARLDGAGNDESGFLCTLHDIVASGRTPAEELLDLYHTRWNEHVEPMFKEFAY